MDAQTFTNEQFRIQFRHKFSWHRSAKCGMVIKKGTPNSQKITCGCIFSCPYCASRIFSARKDELDQVLSWARSEGYSMYHITYTLPHTKYDKLDRTLGDLKNLRSKMFSGRWSQYFKNNHDLVGSVRVLDVSYSLSNGWSPKIHEIITFKTPFETKGREVSCSEAPHEALKDVLWSTYKKRANTIGLSKPLHQEHHLVVTEADGNGSFYFNKWRFRKFRQSS